MLYVIILFAMINSICEKLQFNTETQLKTYLACELSKLDNICPSNIFIHHVRDYSRSEYRFVGEQTIMSKLNSILQYGFSVSPYSSIGGTMMGLGESQNLNINKIIDYKYYDDTELTAKIIFAFPKYVKVKDENLEFSSFNGKTQAMEMDELIKLYREKTSDKPCNHHFKFCVLDAIKSHHNLPQSYILGFLLKYHNKEEYEFLNPHTHLMYGGKEAFDAHEKNVEDKMLNLYHKHGNSLNDVIIAEYKKDMEYYYQLLDMEI